MKLPFELLFHLHLVTASPLLVRRNLPFPSLTGLTHLANDSSTPSTHPSKFFHESTFDAHYDGRFASTPLPPHTRTFHLRLLLRSYMATMERIGVQTWLMHGCLLGWWWNGRIMPWDKDVDVMVGEEGMAELGGWWNVTVHAFEAGELGLGDGDEESAAERMLREEVRKEGKKYLLEVNPHYVNKSTGDKQNVIDARWVDTSTGLYIDITTIHAVPKTADGAVASESKFLAEASTLRSAYLEADREDLHLYTKDQHLFSAGQIFPLRSTTFEGIPVRIPFAYESLLLEEYGPEALTETWFNGYGFDPEKKEWAVAEPTEQQALRLAGTKKSWRKGAKKGKSGKGRKSGAEKVDDREEVGSDVEGES